MKNELKKQGIQRTKRGEAFDDCLVGLGAVWCCVCTSK